MATFTTLPNEALVLILDKTYPEDLDSIVLCCKRLHTFTDPRMRQRISDKISYTWRQLAWPNKGPSETKFGLDELLSRPDIAPSVKTLCISEGSSWSAPGPGIPIFEDLQLTTDDTAWRGLFAVSNCLYIQGSDANAWQTNLDGANIMSVAAVLLTLLPNLEKISFGHLRDSTALVYMVSNIARATYPAHWAFQYERPLSKLSSLSVNETTAASAITGLYEAFASLPSIRSLCAESFLTMNFDHWPQRLTTSNLTHIDFKTGGLRAEDFERLLGQITFLESFKYSYCDTSINYEPAILVGLLKIYAGHSLTDLNLELDPSSDGVIPRDNGCYVGSLRRIERLRRIRIDVSMLCELRENIWVVVKLIDTLPASVEEIRLVGEPATEGEFRIDDLWTGLSEDATIRLPKLSKIEVETVRRRGFERVPMSDETREMRRACLESGISFR